jgi:Cellulase (glycosyl hydrolase family 5)
VRRIARLVLVLCALTAIAAPTAVAAERMWIGFHDDPSFRWVPDRSSRIESASREGASIMRLLVQWNLVAPQRPSNPSNAFDSTYKFDDIDEAVRVAQEQDQEVMLTISGTPRWANGGKNPNVMPRRVTDLTAFARAVASRYSGRHLGYPYVRFWSVWNEPNLQLFLTPQFNSRGRSVAPANYARLYAAAYAGIKAGNPLAKVGIGETSARGSDKATGIRPTHSPGKFAELVAKANPRLKFDAWAHHPYPPVPSLGPGQLVKWPNVSLASMPRFYDSLKTWFRRKHVPIWITEYGHETRPEDRFGVPYSTQTSFVRESIAMARKYSFVDMFIWFVYQDDQGQPWDSGLYGQSGSPKGGSPTQFSRSAKPLDARNGLLAIRGGGLRTPLVTLHTRSYCTKNPAGTPIGMTWRVFRGKRLVAVDQQTSTLRRDCTITARLRFNAARRTTYTATFMLNDRHGLFVTRKLTIRAS